eukprot:COSAG05_NODE_1548_length_4585_cov_2.144226_2_plen_135_part_00
MWVEHVYTYCAGCFAPGVLRVVQVETHGSFCGARKARLGDGRVGTHHRVIGGWHALAGCATRAAGPTAHPARAWGAALRAIASAADITMRPATEPTCRHHAAAHPAWWVGGEDDTTRTDEAAPAGSCYICGRGD